MAKKKDVKLWSKIGVYSYMFGIFIAILVSLATLWAGKGTDLSALTVGILAVLGLVVGLLNITDKEIQTFLIASIAFVAAASGMATVFGSFPGATFDALRVFMSAIVVFTAPGALVVAFKALYMVAKDD